MVASFVGQFDCLEHAIGSSNWDEDNEKNNEITHDKAPIVGHSVG